MACRSRGRLVLGKPPVIFVNTSSRAAEKILRLALVTSGVQRPRRACSTRDPSWSRMIAMNSTGFSK